MGMRRSVRPKVVNLRGVDKRPHRCRTESEAFKPLCARWARASVTELTPSLEEKTP